MKTNVFILRKSVEKSSLCSGLFVHFPDLILQTYTHCKVHLLMGTGKSCLSTLKNNEVTFHLFFLKGYNEAAVSMGSLCFSPVNFIPIDFFLTQIKSLLEITWRFVWMWSACSMPRWYFRAIFRTEDQRNKSEWWNETWKCLGHCKSANQNQI